MNIRLSILIIIASIFLWSPSLYAQHSIVINEFMASNASTIADEDGDYEDWIELYNPTNLSVNLQGWGLSDDADNPMRWVFPDVEIPAQGFLLVWASGKDRIGSTLHSNFSISAAGEPLLLSTSNGVLVDFIQPTQQYSDISYGRKPDGSQTFYYFEESSPEASNSGESFYGKTDKPEIFIDHIHDRLFVVSIHHASPQSVIYYTTDSSKPHVHSPIYETSFSFVKKADSLMYIRTSPIEAENSNIYWISPKGVLPVAASVRAIAQKEGYLPSDIQTKTSVNLESSLPIISINTDADHFFSDETGIYVPGNVYNELGWNENNYWGMPNANYYKRGAEWERDANIEFFYPNGEYLSQQVGIRMHGGASRTLQAKSLRIYARNMYGENTIHFNVFNTQKEEYRRLLLRNSGQDFLNTLFRDAFNQSLVAHMNFGIQKYQPAIVFINSEFWGIKNLRERLDKYYLQRNFGLEPDKLDLLTGRNRVIEGDNQHYIATLNYIRDYGVEEHEHYSYIQTRIDTESFIDYQISNIYINNIDWPGNNIDYWRARTAHFEPDAPYGHDGRWRWLLYDTDYGFRGSSERYKENSLESATAEGGTSWPNPDWSTFMLRNLLQNEDFKTAFINRFADQLNTAFLPQRAIQKIHDFQARIEPYKMLHIDRWGRFYSMEKWHDQIQTMHVFATHRPYYQRQHIRDFFNLEGNDKRIRLDVTNHLHGHVKINTINIKGSTTGINDFPYPWTGWYFPQIPINISAHPAPGYKFTHWSEKKTGTVAQFEYTPDAHAQFKAHFEPTFEPLLIQYWHFDDNISNNTPLETLSASYHIYQEGHIEFRSCLPEYPYNEGHPFWRKASMERRNSPTPLNYRPEGNQDQLYKPENMKGIQIKPPFVHNQQETELIFHLPIKGAQDVFFSFAAKDEGAAYGFIIDYSTKPHEQWTTAGLNQTQYTLSSDYQLYLVDLSKLEDATEFFKIRIRMLSHHPESFGSGRVSFNNFSLDGIICMAHTIETHKTGPGHVYPVGNVGVYECGNRDFFIQPHINHQVKDVLLDGKSILDQLETLGNNTFNLRIKFPKDKKNLMVHFNKTESYEDDEGIIVYPNPAKDIIHIASKEEIKEVKIYDIRGSLADRKEIHNNYNYLNIEGLQNGIYIIQIILKDKRISRKIVIQK